MTGRGAIHVPSHLPNHLPSRAPSSAAPSAVLLPAGPLRTSGIESRRRIKPIGKPNRNFCPSDAPRGSAAVPPDLAPAVVQLNDGVIGARRCCGGATKRQDANSKGQSLHRQLPVVPYCASPQVFG